MNKEALIELRKKKLEKIKSVRLQLNILKGSFLKLEKEIEEINFKIKELPESKIKLRKKNDVQTLSVS